MQYQDRTRILLAEGDANARLALREYLNAQTGLDVVAEVADCRTLLAQTETTCPDLVLLEWDLPRRPQADLIAALQRLSCQPLVVAYGKQPDASISATDAGADAYVYKGMGPRQMLTTIRWVVVEARYAQPRHRDDV
jgi:DNA-binding NarL/FixJ family response regulator